MMAGNPNWWSMQSELRSTSDHLHNNHHLEQESNNNIINNNNNNNNMFISQIHPSNNSNLLSINNNHHQYLHESSSNASSSSLMPFISLVDHNHAQDFPHSWSQLLLGGMASEQEEERFISTTRAHFQPTRVMNNVKPEVNCRSNIDNCDDNNNNNNNLYGNQYHHDDQQQQEDASLGLISNNRATTTNWSQIMPISSPKSCITTLSSKTNTNTNNNDIINNNMLDFTTNNKRSLDSLQADETHQHTDHSNSECNSSANGGVSKKPRVQSSSNPPLKVRKEKLGDRITSLHQLVSPFGKTDTASVLLEAIGYIRFLQSQIEALSSPYLACNNATVITSPSIHGERNCLFPDHPGQLLNDSCMKRRGAATQEDKQGVTKDLKSRGLCLVPISCTQLVGSDNGADYWAQSLSGGY